MKMYGGLMFAIVRIDKHTGDKTYFNTFEYQIDDNNAEEYGTECWTNDILKCFKFDSFLECKAWLDIMQVSPEDFIYQINLYRYKVENSKETYIPLKNFYELKY